MPDVPAAIARALRRALDDLGAGVEVEAAVERSARPEFGDWSSPAPLRAARVLRRNPMEIAQALRERLEAGGVEHVAAWTVSPPGYLNARLDDTTWAPAVIADALALDAREPIPVAESARVPGMTLVEHTSINTNKAAHVGHLRNACIGDAVARLLRRTGQEVEVNNYIDDTGVQVADVVVAVRELGIQPEEGEPFDRFCSRAYVEVGRRYEADPALLQRRAMTLRDIEARDTDVARFAKDLATRVLRAQLATMARFDIHYDLLTWESDILELGFWERAFNRLRDAGAIVYADSGRNAGCWVLPARPGEEGEVPDGDTAGPDAEDREAKVLVKSDGVATYTAKDIAYHLWKFGLIDRDFHYRRWDASDPTGPVTTTARDGDPAIEARQHHAARAVTVIDARQAYLQRVVREALRRSGHAVEAERCLHLGYEVVALTPAAAAALGVEVEDGRGVVALSGRRGIEVRADDLLDQAVARVRDKAQDDASALALAAGALRYYLLRFGLETVIAFDFDQALQTTGDSGVYLQYAHARAAGILRRVPADDGEVTAPADRLMPVERALLHRLDGHRAAVAEAAAALAPSVLAAHALALASALSDFYEHTPPIVREEDPAVRRFRRALVAATRSTLADALQTLGMPAPDRI